DLTAVAGHEEERRSAIARLHRDGAALERLRLAPPQQRGELAHRRGIEERSDPEHPAELALDLAEHAKRQQRMAAGLEEVVVGAEVRPAQDVAPDAEQLARHGVEAPARV